MARRRPRPVAPPSLRNGMKWREGRPRWEPSPASRRAGLGGRDLVDATGAWLERGAAIGAADARALWAELIRETHKDGPIGVEARANLSAALDALPAPADAGDRQRRVLVEDLIAAARERLGQAVVLHTRGGPRTVAAMVTGYFAGVDAGEVEISLATRKNYQSASKRLIAKFGELTVGEVSRGALRAWYLKMKQEDSVFTANLCIGAAGAFFKWATWQDGWLVDSPCTMLGRTGAPGRRVFWMRDEELTFIPWCDANHFEDVADGVTAGLWTGARSFDLCAADLADFKDTWRYTPHKTQKKGREALPGVLEPLRLRLARRAQASAQDGVRWLNATPFLWDFRTRRRHTTASFSQRFREAKTAALLAGAVPDTLQGKHMQDTRDTCITRLYLADVKLDRIPSWTAHSPDDRDEILREHYLVLQDAAALEDAAKLETWARKEGLTL